MTPLEETTAILAAMGVEEDLSECAAIAEGRRVPSAAVLRCKVCWRRGRRRGNGNDRPPGLAIAHVQTSHNRSRDETTSGLCLHDRTKGGGRKRSRDPDGVAGYHEDYNGLAGDRDLDADSECTWKCRRGHRLRGTAGVILAKVERGQKVIYIDAA